MTLSLFEKCLTSLLELAKIDDEKGLVFVDRVVSTYLASQESSKDETHPCDGLAEAFMKRAPETDVKNHILDKLFQIEPKPEP